MLKAAQKTFFQAYRIAPWRDQYQVLGVFALVIVSVALVAGVYLSVTARAATMGREVQVLQDQILTTKQHNAALETTLALITSSSIMEQRAQALGFVPADPSDILYLPVPGYHARSEAVFAPPPALASSNQPALAPEFSQSLFAWLGYILQEPERIEQVITQIQPTSTAGAAP
jgi:hypothetical protein